MNLTQELKEIEAKLMLNRRQESMLMDLKAKLLEIEKTKNAD